MTTMMCGQRIVSRVVPATGAGPFKRLIGTTDFKGQGTKHDVEHVDPVVLLDDSGIIKGANLPKFGLHPHFGLIAVTYVLEGKFSDMDNLSGQSEALNEAGDVYVVSAGRGVAHREKSEFDGENRGLQTILKIPKANLEFEPEHIKVKKDKLPFLDVEGGTVQVVVGNTFGVKSPAWIKALPRFTYLRVRVNPGSQINIPIDEDLEHGYAYVISGDKGFIASTAIQPGSNLYLIERGFILNVRNDDSEAPMDLVVCAGQPLNEPWVKLLGFNGFIIAEDEAQAETVMANITKAGVENFSYKNNPY